MTKTKLWFYFGLAIMCFALSVNTAASQTLEWSPNEEYDLGQDPSVAVHPSGLVLEGHRTQGGNTLWYHLGMLNGTSVTWGGSQRLSPTSGLQNWPNVAISKEGYVIFVYSIGLFKAQGDLYYAVGKIDPYGGTDQSITWLTNTEVNGTYIDRGFHSSIAINDSGVILLVFESGTGGNGLYYRVGHLSNPAAGDYTIKWDSGKYGTHYDAGINPHIALNNLNEVVEVHQVSDNDHLLHYRRGNVSGGTISFGGSQRYDSNASTPAVSLLDSGLVVELHQSGEQRVMYARTGTLSASNLERIEWFDSVNIGLKWVEDPAVASNGSYAIGTWQYGVRLVYSVAALP